MTKDLGHFGLGYNKDAGAPATYTLKMGIAFGNGSSIPKLLQWVSHSQIWKIKGVHENVSPIPR